jgi:hypothetical protein
MGRSRGDVVLLRLRRSEWSMSTEKGRGYRRRSGRRLASALATLIVSPYGSLSVNVDASAGAESAAESLSSFLNKLLRSAILFSLLAVLGTHCAAAEATNRDLAIAYVRALPSDKKIYVWPTKLRVFEIVGRVDLAAVSANVTDYAGTYPEMMFWPFPRPPQVSIFAYDDETADPWEEFVAVSQLLDAFKRSLNPQALKAQACSFTGLVTRDTWAAGGAVFLDRSRLSAEEQRECIDAGLDYINGFPAPARFDYRQLPSKEVRELILKAVTKCSVEGPIIGEPLEKTKDGLTPLPSIDCVLENLSD